MKNEIKKSKFSLSGRVTHIYNSPDLNNIRVYLNTKTIDLNLTGHEEIKLGEMVEINFSISDKDIIIKPKKYQIKKGGEEEITNN